MSMREIKFRGWNKQSKVMVNDIQVYSPKDTLSLNSCFDRGMIVLPLQYTGLKDKNGKEIYQSDRCAMNSYLTSEVRYKENMGAWYVGGRRLTKKLASQIEVTGNKYEN